MRNPYLDPVDPRDNPYLRPAGANPYFDPNPVNPYLQQAPSGPPVPEIVEPTQTYNEVEKGLLRGANSMGPAIDRATAAVQGVLGYEEAAQANLDAARQAEQALAANERLRPRIARFRDAQSAGDYLDWGLGMAAEQLPLAATMLGSGGLGALGGIARTGVANKALRAVAGMAPYWAQTVSENSQNIMDDPNAQGTFQEKSLGVVGGGTAQALVGGIPIAGVLGKVLKPGMSLGKRVGSAMATGVVGEGFTEMGEEGIGKATHKLFNPEVQLNSKEAWLDYVDALAGGAVVGGAFGGGGALASHPFLARMAQRDPDGPLGFAQKHRRLFGDQDLETLSSLSPEKPRSKLQAKLWEIEDRQNLDIAYNDLLGMTGEQYAAKRKEAETVLDNLAFSLYSGTAQREDPWVQAYLKDPALSQIVDRYINENEEVWQKQGAKEEREDQIASEFGEMLQALELDPATTPEQFVQQVQTDQGLAERMRQFKAYQEGREESTLSDEAPDWKRNLLAQMEEDRTAERDALIGDLDQLNLTDSDKAEFDTDPRTALTEQETKSEFRLNTKNQPWEPLSVTIRKKGGVTPEEEEQYRKDRAERRERNSLEFLPIEAQEEYTAAREKGTLDQWRERWGEEAAKFQFNEAPLLDMLRDEFPDLPVSRAEANEPGDMTIEDIVEKRFLPRASAVIQKMYEGKPLEYAKEFVVERRALPPNLVSGRDELTPTMSELNPEKGWQDAQVIQDKERARKVLEKESKDLVWNKVFDDKEKDTLGRFFQLSKPDPNPEKDRVRQTQLAEFIDQNKELVARNAAVMDLNEELDRAIAELGEDIKNLDRKSGHVIVDPPSDKWNEEDSRYDTQDRNYALKRIPIQQKRYHKGKWQWVDKSIDTMQLVLQEMTYKRNFPPDTGAFIDRVAEAFESGLAGILSNPALGIRLDPDKIKMTERTSRIKHKDGTEILRSEKFPALDPRTIIYSRRSGGLQIRWGDIEVKGNERYKRIMQGLEARRAEVGPEAIKTAERDAFAEMRKTAEGAKFVAQKERWRALRQYASDPKALSRELRQVDAGGGYPSAKIERKRALYRQYAVRPESLKQELESAQVRFGNDPVRLRKEQMMIRRKYNNLPKLLEAELGRIERQEREDLRAIRQQKAADRNLTLLERKEEEAGTSIDTPRAGQLALPADQSVQMNDGIAREAGPVVPDTRKSPVAKEPERWAMSHANGYELSTKKDARFSALNARFKDGTRLHDAIKTLLADNPGLAEIEPWKLYDDYKELWFRWADENPDLIEDLRKKSAGRPLTDAYMRRGQLSPARALADYLERSKPKGITESGMSGLRAFAAGQESEVATPRAEPNTQTELPLFEGGVTTYDEGTKPSLTQDPHLGRDVAAPMSEPRAPQGQRPPLMDLYGTYKKEEELPKPTGEFTVLPKQAAMELGAPETPRTTVTQGPALPYQRELPGPVQTRMKKQYSAAPAVGDVVPLVDSKSWELTDEEIDSIEIPSAKPLAGNVDIDVESFRRSGTTPAGNPDLLTNPRGQANGLRTEEAKQAPDQAPAAVAAPPTRNTSASGEPINIHWGANQNRELSNLALRPFTDPNGMKYHSVEHAYQTWKSGKFNKTIYENPRWAQGGVKIPGWPSKKENNWNVNFMKHLIRASFQQNPEAAKRLLATGNAKLTHVQDRGVWAEAFPRLLMEVREELRAAEKPAESAVVITEHPSGSYQPRTQLNADKGDVTMAFAIDYASPGEKRTRSDAGDKYIRWEPGTSLDAFADQVVAKLKAVNGRVLNIAGNGVYTWEKHADSKGQPLNQARVNYALHRILKRVKEQYPQLERVVTGGQTGSDMAGAIAAKALGIPVEITFPKNFLQRHKKGVDTPHTREDIQRQLEEGVRGLTVQDNDLPSLNKIRELGYEDYKKAETTLKAHDLRQEAAFANRMLSDLGIDVTVRLATMEEAYKVKGERITVLGSTWTNEAGERLIYLNPMLSRTIRLEVLSHELGHIVMFNAWENADETLKKAVQKAYDEWYQQYSKDGVSAFDINASKKALNSMLWAGQSDGSVLKDMDEATRNYLLNFDEWFADQVSRWMTSDAKPVGLIEEFFKYVADLIRDLFHLVDKQNPDRAVARFMNSLIEQNEEFKRWSASTEAPFDTEEQWGAYPDWGEGEVFDNTLGNKQAPRVQVGPNANSITNQNAQGYRDYADQVGLTNQIEELFALGLTAGQVRTRLKDRLNALNYPIEDQANLIISVRATLGIPSRADEEGKKEFEVWKKEYEARQNAQPSAPPPTNTQEPDIELPENDWEQDTEDDGRYADDMGVTQEEFNAASAEYDRAQAEVDSLKGVAKWEKYLNQSRHGKISKQKAEEVHGYFNDVNWVDVPLKKAKYHRDRIKRFLDKMVVETDDMPGWPGWFHDMLWEEHRTLLSAVEVIEEREAEAATERRRNAEENRAQMRARVEARRNGTPPPPPPSTGTPPTTPPPASTSGGGRPRPPRTPPTSLPSKGAPPPRGTTARGTGFTPEERRVLGQAFRAAHVQRQLRDLLQHDPKALNELRDPDKAIAYGYQLWLQGSLKVGPQTNTAFKRLLKAALDTVGEVDVGTQAEAILHAPGANVHVAQLTNTAIQKGYARLKEYSTAVMDLARKAAYMGHDQLRAIENPFVDRIAELIYNEVGKEGVAEGFLSATTRRVGHFLDKLQNIFDGHDAALGDRVMDLLTKRADLATATAKERELTLGVYKLLEELRAYAQEADVDLGLQGRTITIDGVKTRDYFPRIINVDYLMAHKDEFATMLKQPKYASQKADPDDVYRAYLENYGIESQFNPNAEVGAPQSSSFKKRKFDWIDDKDIAPYLSQDLGEALSAYIHQSVKHTEWQRRFGGKNSEALRKLKGQPNVDAAELARAKQSGGYLDLLEKARETGLTPEQEERVTAYMQGVLGTLGTDINPTLNAVQSWMLVLQNWALLGLSAITSLADIAGLAVRGDLQTAWEGLRSGINEVVSLVKGNKTALKSLAEMLGTIERHTAIEALGFEYGGYRITESARKWNDRLFRWNLLQSWTRGTRLMALAAGKSFIAKHVQDPGTHSQRFLDQLNLRKGDVQFDANGDIRILSQAERDRANAEEKARDDRVRAALNQFVDEAILRPNAAERPIYFNDPHWMLFSHLKQYVYSFHAIILRRVANEAMEGNFMPLVGVMGYVPITMAAMALKDAIRGGDDEDKDWVTFTNEAVTRSGVLGFGQVFLDVWGDENYGKMTGSSLLDPTSESLMDLMEALFNESDTDEGDALARFLPLQSIWDYWGD